MILLLARRVLVQRASPRLTDATSPLWRDRKFCLQLFPKLVSARAFARAKIKKSKNADQREMTVAPI